MTDELAAIAGDDYAVRGYVQIGWPFELPDVVEARRNTAQLIAIGAMVTVRGVPDGTVIDPNDDGGAKPGETVHMLEQIVPLCLLAGDKIGARPEALRAAGYVAVSASELVDCTDCLGWMHA